MSTLLLLALLAAAPAAGGQSQDHKHHQALNDRGRRFMGFDQQTTTHHFILAAEGGRIEVTANRPEDAASISQIRQHLRHIAQAFAKGDFTAPGLVHDRKVPGVDQMKAAGAAITYRYEEIERGARVRVSGTTPAAVAAIHEFLRFQIKDHGTGDPLVVR